MTHSKRSGDWFNILSSCQAWPEICPNWAWLSWLNICPTKLTDFACECYKMYSTGVIIMKFQYLKGIYSIVLFWLSSIEASLCVIISRFLSLMSMFIINLGLPSWFICQIRTQVHCHTLRSHPAGTKLDIQHVGCCHSTNWTRDFFIK